MSFALARCHASDVIVNSQFRVLEFMSKAIKLDRPPTDQTYYVVDGEYYIQQYKRIFIRRRARRSGGTKK